MARRPSSIVSAAGAGVWLAAFGKHPGWNDHIDDLGIETDPLVKVKRLLYTQGISKLIDTGFWESLPADRRSEGFDHTFIWRIERSIVVGRMWSSSDGRGRRKYPMIVCAQVLDKPWSFISERVLPRLRQLEAECRAAETAASVMALTEAARAELRAAAERVGPAPRDPLPGPGVLAGLAGHAALGPAGVGLERVLYEIERNFSAFLLPDRAGTKSRSRTMEVRAQQVRVPRLTSSEPDDLSSWTRLMLTRVDPNISMLLLSGPGDWQDVIVGDVSPKQLECIQSGPLALPLTSEIPFSLDDAARQDIAARVEASRRGEPAEFDPGCFSGEKERFAGLTRAKAAGSAADPGPRKLLVPVAASVGIAGVALVAVIGLMQGGSGKGGATGPRPGNGAAVDPPPGEGDNTASGTNPDVTEPDPAPEGGARDGAAVATPGLAPEQAAALARWCEVAAAGLIDAANAARASEDAYVTGAIGPALASAGDLTRLDPAAWLPLNGMDPGQAAAALRRGEGPRPDDLPGAIAAAGRAAALDAALTALLDSRDWPARRDAATVEAALRAAGASGAADALKSMLDGGPGPGGAAPSRAERISGLSKLAPTLAAIAAPSGLSVEQAQRLTATGDAVLAGFPAAAEAMRRAALASVREPADLATAAGRIGAIERSGAALVAFVEGPWSGVDAAALAAASPVYGQIAAAASPELYDQWLMEAASPAYAAIDAGADPRVAMNAAERLAAEQARLAAVPRGQSPALDARLAALDAEARALAGHIDALQAQPWNRAGSEAIAAEAAAVAASLQTHTGAVSALLTEVQQSGADVVAAMRAANTVSADGVAVVDEAWRRLRDELIEAYARNESWGELAGAAAVLERTLVNQMEGAIAGMPMPGSWSGVIDTAALARAVAARRSATLAEVIRAANWDGVRFITADAAIAGAAPAHQAWLDRVSDEATALAAAAQAVLSGARGDEAPAGGAASLVALARPWMGDTGAAADAEMAAAYAPAVALARAWGAAAASTDRGELAAMAADPAQPAVIAAEAWRRLAGLTPPWPANVEELRRDLACAAGLSGPAGERMDAARRDALRAEVAAALPARWAAAAGAVTSEADLRAVLALAPSAGVDAATLPKDLPARVRFNLRVLAARDGVGAVAGSGQTRDEAAASAFVRSLADDARLIAGDLTPQQAGQVSGWLDDLLTLATEEPGATPPLDPATAGPGRAGFSVETQADGQRLVYRAPGGDPGRTLAFVRVEGPNGPVYLGEHEAPTWLLTGSALDAAATTLIQASLPPVEMNTNSRFGPRTWEWAGAAGRERPVAARRWLAKDHREPYPAEIAASVGVPTEAHPLTGVSPLTALLVARAVGCRVPSAEEWSAGAAVSSERATANLRDATWAAQQAHMMPRPTGDQEFPSYGAFGETSTPQAAVSETAGPGSDGVLWFRPATPGTGLRDLVGNVAEYVVAFDGSGAALRGDLAEVAALPGDAAGVEDLFWGGGVRVEVIGGSALSPPERPVDEPAAWAMTRGRRPWVTGWVDVGFRLAFDATGAQPIGPRAARLVAGAPLLWDR